MSQGPTMGAPATMLNDDTVSIRPTLASLHDRHARAAGRALDRLLAEKPCCACCCAPTEQVSDLDTYLLGGMTLGWVERDARGRELAAAGWRP